MTNSTLTLDGGKDRTRRAKRYDLPLQRGNGGQLVSWIVGVMTYLTALALVVIFGLNQLQHYWQQGLTGHVTIEIANDDARVAGDAKIDRLVDELNKIPDVTAKRLTNDDIGQLVGPWLGGTDQIAELPLPALIDVERKAGDEIAQILAVQDAIKKHVPNAVLDTHQEWLADLLKLAKAGRMLLIGIALVLAVTTAVTVAATARTRLALHRDEVDLLHLIGATDQYIATQFQRQAFRLATEGAAAGMVMAAMTVFSIGFVKRQMGDGLLPGISLSWVEIGCLVGTPLIAGLIAMAASRVTVLKALKQLP